MEKTYQDISQALFSDPQKSAGDTHFYGQVKSIVTDANNKVTGYNVNLGGDTGTTFCRKLAGAKVGSTVMVTLMGKSKVATVTATLGGDTDAADADKKAEDLTGRIEDGEFSPEKVVIQYCLASANAIPSGGTFDDIRITPWSETLPTFVTGKYYWTRTVTYMGDETQKASSPVLALTAQTAAEVDIALASTNNHFWHDNTGAYVTTAAGSYSSGYATRITTAGIIQSYDGKTLSTWTNSGVVFYDSTAQVGSTLVPIATYGSSGAVIGKDAGYHVNINSNGIDFYNDASTKMCSIKYGSSRSRLVRTYGSYTGAVNFVGTESSNSIQSEVTATKSDYEAKLAVGLSDYTGAASAILSAAASSKSGSVSIYSNGTYTQFDVDADYISGITPSKIGAAASSHTHSGYASSSHTHSSFGTLTTGPITMTSWYSTDSSNPNCRIGTEGTHLGRIQQTSGSSKRFKVEISPVKNPEIDPQRLYDIDVVQFKFKEGYLHEGDIREGKDIIGFIAEQVDEVFPIAVDRANGFAENWNDRYIIPPMLALIQRQKKMIDELTARVNTLEQNIA